VTIGGAIAADVHGKNHHIDGSFCDHVASVRVMLATGEVIDCHRESNAELFHATCGGMGLTGIILDAAIKLMPLSSLDIAQRSLAAGNLQDCMDLMEEHDDAKYSVAWIDCLATGAAQGRSVLYLGEHVDEQDAREKSKPGRKGLRAIQRSELNIPFDAPSILLNKYTMAGFNSAYYALQKRRATTKRIAYDSFFFPLERLRNWNRLYGAKGFLQYQLALPQESAHAGISAILSCASQAGKGSFLSVLKKFGKANSNLLSFPIEGYTLALDFKYEASLFPLLDKLDTLVLDHGGRLYLAKDARMSKECFQQSYGQWERFAELRQKFDPKGKFSSLQSRRLGLS
jgi:FAD/FMN-containing dehydrogenase